MLKNKTVAPIFNIAVILQNRALVKKNVVVKQCDTLNLGLMLILYRFIGTVNCGEVNLKGLEIFPLIINLIRLRLLAFQHH